jgi:hypothetical protein
VGLLLLAGIKRREESSQQNTDSTDEEPQ